MGLDTPSNRGPHEPRLPRSVTLLHSFRYWLIALLASFIASNGYATELVGRVEIAPVSATSVTIRWRTDVVTGTRFFYGLDRTSFAIGPMESSPIFTR